MTQFKGFAGNSEAQLRQIVGALYEQESAGLAKDGVLTGLSVVQTNTASGSVVVARGAGVVQDSALSGAVPLVNDTGINLDVLGANPMTALARNDIVVFDSATTSIRVVVGTPNASPTDPAVPATALPLARIRHLASATKITSSRIDDLRVPTTLFDREAKASGYGEVVVSGATTGNTTVTFPAGRFTGTPVVQLSNSGAYAVQFSGVSATGMTVTARRLDGASFTATVTFSWVATGDRPL